MTELELEHIKLVDDDTMRLGYGYLRELEELSLQNENNRTPDLIIFYCILFFYEPLKIGKYDMNKNVTVSQDLKTFTTGKVKGCGWSNCYSNLWFYPKQTNKKTIVILKINEKSDSYNISVGLSGDETEVRGYRLSKKGDSNGILSKGYKYDKGKRIDERGKWKFGKGDEIGIVMFDDTVSYEINGVQIAEFSKFEGDKYKVAVAMFSGPHSVSFVQLSTEKVDQ